MKNATCCRRLRDAINDDAFPVNYDSRIEEVQLFLLVIGGVAVIRYCPFCGQKLESGRANRFTKPTDGDLEDVRRRLESLTSLDQVIATLGKPSDEGTGCGFVSKPWVRWLRYSDVWASLELTIGEEQNGGISWGVGGRELTSGVPDVEVKSV